MDQKDDALFTHAGREKVAKILQSHFNSTEGERGVSLLVTDSGFMDAESGTHVPDSEAFTRLIMNTASLLSL